MVRLHFNLSHLLIVYCLILLYLFFVHQELPQTITAYLIYLMQELLEVKIEFY